MRDEPLTLVEREVLGWPEVTASPGRFGSTVYRYGRKEIGHLHGDGVADLPFPRAIHDELVSDGRASLHRAGSSGYVSYRIHAPEDVQGAIELFRINYERAKATAEQREARGREREGFDDE